ncbi:MAG: hypothetical protein GY716_04915 [bacterium]|nr:hypothetical protein [bacterium]
MRRCLVGLALVATLLAVPGPRAELLSKSYVFKPGVNLELGVATGDGLRIDSVRFDLPPTSGARYQRPGGLVRAQVAVSNTASKTLKVGLAVALFDAEEQLVGVANGGTTVVGIKPGRQKTYKLVFDGVNGHAHRAEEFQISIESKP